MKKNQAEALRLADALAYCDSSVASQATAELRRMHAQVELLQTERDRYSRMFGAACEALGAVSEVLGIDPDDGGAEPILEAIEELKAKTLRHALTDEQWQALADATDLIINRPLMNEISAILQLPAE